MCKHKISGTCNCGEHVSFHITKTPYYMTCKKCGVTLVLDYDVKDQVYVIEEENDRR